jgi:hypothetical protein
MKTSSLIGIAACAAILLSVVCSKAAPTVLNSIRAVVNNEPITQAMVDSAVRTQVQVWLMGNKGRVSRSQAEKEIREMEQKALNDLIDRKLILSEFKKMGGNIKDQYVDEAVNSFVKDRFGGERDKFLDELKKNGMTISQFREVQRDMIAINALRAEHAGDDVIPNTPWEKKRVYNEIKTDFASDGKPKVWIMSIPKQTPTSSEASLHSRRSILMTVSPARAATSEFLTVQESWLKVCTISPTVSLRVKRHPQWITEHTGGSSMFPNASENQFLLLISLKRKSTSASPSRSARRISKPGSSSFVVMPMFASTRTKFCLSVLFPAVASR